jgi:plastocyanin
MYFVPGYRFAEHRHRFAAAGPSAKTIKSFAFSPQEMTVTQGTAVTWTTQDRVRHTIVANAGATKTFSPDSLPRGILHVYLHKTGHLPVPLPDPSVHERYPLR